MLCLTETWLKLDEYTILNESTPQDYCYENEPRPEGKEGGVATIYSNTLSISQKTGFKYRRFHRAHAPGPKLTSGLYFYIGLVVSVAGYKHS